MSTIFFTNKDKEGFRALKFLISARGKDENRFNLTKIFCDSDKTGAPVLIATNGRCLHSLSCANSAKMLFELKKCYDVYESANFIALDITKDDCNYPNWKAAISDEKNIPMVFSIEHKNKEKTICFIARLYRLLGRYKAPNFNPDFLKIFEQVDCAHFGWSVENKILCARGMIGHQTFKAIIMPIERQ